MELLKKYIQMYKDSIEKESEKEISWEDASEGAYNMMRFTEVIYDYAIRENERKLKLKKNPKGFHLEGNGYSCSICGGIISNEETWYDTLGIKCLVCQKAIDKRIIPGSVAKKEYSWYSKYDLESSFNINSHVMKKFIKEGILKPRIVPNSAGKPHVYLFLIKDNKDTLPPKKLIKSQMVKEMDNDGKEWFQLEPWYRFVDPHKALKGYKIMDYLKVVYEEE